MKTLIKQLTTGAMLAVLPFGFSQAGEALDRVMSNKVMKVATSADWAPQSFINDDNQMDGFDINVAQEVGKRLGVEVEFVTPDWAVITAGNWHARWDVSVGSMTPTKERTKVLDFPAVYYYTPASFVAHESSKAEGHGDLQGVKIGVTTASVHELFIQQDLTIDAEGVPDFDYVVKTDNVGSYQSSNVALDDLRLGDGVRLSAVLTSLPTINQAIKNGYPLKVVGAPVFYEPLAIAVDKGDAEFNAKLAEIVKTMQSDGTLSELSLKWYGFDYTIAD